MGLRVRHRACWGLLVAALAAASCSHSPTQPAPLPVDITGNWSGSASDTTGFGDLVWHVTQSGGTFSGTVDITDRTVNVTGVGTVSGSILEGAIQFTLQVPAGGFQAPYDACATTVTGEGTASQTSLTGTYAGTSTCGKIYSGSISLRRL